jgi:hypothetical protein
MKHLYTNGYPWLAGTEPETNDDMLTTNLNDIYDRVHKNNKASVIVVDGFVGEGKTTIAYALCHWLETKSFKCDWIEPEETIFMGMKEILPAVEKYKLKKKALVYDEAGDYSKSQSMSKEGKQMDRFFQTFRAYKIVLIMTAPCFYHISNKLYDSAIARFLVHCHDRVEGVGGEFKVYDMRTMDFMRYYAEKHSATKNDCYRYFKPAFHGKWKELPDKIAKKISKRGIKGKAQINTEAAIKMNGWVSYNDLVKEFGKSQKHIRDKLNDRGIKPTNIKKKVKYFNKEDYNIIKKVFKSQPKP